MSRCFCFRDLLRPEQRDYIDDGSCDGQGRSLSHCEYLFVFCLRLRAFLSFISLLSYASFSLHPRHSSFFSILTVFFLISILPFLLCPLSEARLVCLFVYLHSLCFPSPSRICVSDYKPTTARVSAIASMVSMCQVPIL